MSYSPDQASDAFPGSLLSDGVASASSSRTAVTSTASAVANATTGVSFTEITPSLTANAAGIQLHVTTNVFTSATNSSTVLEIGTGAAASEVVWATVPVGYRQASAAALVGVPIMVPGFIAAGTRVSVRARSAIAAQAVSVVANFLPATKAAVPGAPVTYQYDSSASRGLTITAPGSLNTKGAWTELVTSTADALAALTVGVQAAGATTMSSTGVLIDIGIGAAASETVLLADIELQGNSSEFYASRCPSLYGVYIPAGTRISARYARANSGNAVDIILIGAKAT